MAAASDPSEHVPVARTIGCVDYLDFGLVLFMSDCYPVDRHDNAPNHWVTHRAAGLLL